MRRRLPIVATVVEEDTIEEVAALIETTFGSILAPTEEAIAPQITTVHAT